MESSKTTTLIDPVGGLKRKRSPSVSLPPPAPKSAKTSGQLSINYLARQSHEDLPLINKDDTLPNLLHLLSAYSSILDRHESLASNLGARPLGPILIKRFERCFDAPPKVVASHYKGAAAAPDESTPQITWLEVIEFARAHQAQFTLSSFSEGQRVCQFYYPQKQLRVQISEEDFLFINSGRCQELIPPLPIWEDEEKEVATCDLMEAKLKELTNAADMIAARTRQLGHRLKGRRAAILERRAEGGSGTPAKAGAIQTTTAPPSAAASSSSFVAVNAANSRLIGEPVETTLSSSSNIRNELLRHLESLPHNQNQGSSQLRQPSVVGLSDSASIRPSDIGSIAPFDNARSTASSLSPVPTHVFNNNDPAGSTPDPSFGGRQHGSSNAQSHRPSSSAANNSHASGHAPGKHNFSRPLPEAIEHTQPFRPLCQAHMDSLPRGHRVLPPCDRCRRLRMDCVKNLTSCAGCTRKHARCHWRDVSRDELGALDHLMDSTYQSAKGAALSPSTGYSVMANGHDYDYPHHDDSDEDDDSNPLEDLEALGEKEEQESRIREDEEGLRTERELAKQGWEDQLRSAAQDMGFGTAAQVPDSDAIEAASKAANADPAGISRKEMNGNTDASTPTPITPLRHHSYDPVHDHSQSGLRISDDGQPPANQSSLAPMHTGFRAVNNAIHDNAS